MLFWTLGCKYLWTIVFSKYMPRSGIEESYGSSIFSFFGKHHTILQSGCTRLHFHQRTSEILAPPSPPQKQVPSNLLISENLLTVKWSLTIVLFFSFSDYMWGCLSLLEFSLRSSTHFSVFHLFFVDFQNSLRIWDIHLLLILDLKLTH